MTAAFVLLALIALASAVLTVVSRNIVHAALWLIVSLLALAGIFLILGAEFVAAVQVMVYAGSVVVLFVFVVMTVGGRQTPQPAGGRGRHLPAALLGALVFGELVAGLLRLGTPRGPGRPLEVPPAQAMSQTARLLFNEWLIPMEVFSLIALAAMIGIGMLRREEGDKR